MNIADLRSVFHWTVDHWKTWGVTGLVVGMAKGIQVGLRHLYAWILVRYDNARDEIKNRVRASRGATYIVISDEEVIARTRLPKWLILRAQNWEKRKKKLGS